MGFVVAFILLFFTLATFGQDRAEQLFRKGIQLQKSGKLEQALDNYEQCLKFDPKHYGALLAVGKISFSKGNYAEAEQRFTDIIDQYPKDVGALLYLAYTKMKTGRAEQARMDFSRILDFRPKSVAALIGMGKAERLLGKGFTANYYFKKALRMRPGITSVQELVARQEEANLRDLAAHPVAKYKPRAKPARKTTGQQITGKTSPGKSIPPANGDSPDAARKTVIDDKMSESDSELRDDGDTE
jgi:tetratricopeptide (TPR) repeat protein